MSTANDLRRFMNAKGWSQEKRHHFTFSKAVDSEFDWSDTHQLGYMVYTFQDESKLAVAILPSGKECDVTLRTVDRG